jgi:carboxylesterase type B
MHIAHSVSVAGAVLMQFASAALASYQVGGPVSTTSGTVTGIPGKNAPEVSAYLGIPFAYPPVGARRWLAPERFKAGAPINATKFGPDCPGTLSLGVSGKESGAVTEDCLYLSVWVPQKKAGDAPKAVLIWIYGGAFVGGGTSWSMSDGARLAAKEDVVVVAGNYRLSIFGFPGGPGLPDQNLGLLDQRMTVEWVRDNIAAFGGDPNKIVLVRTPQMS